ncbi:MAG: hypothetical protein GW803_06220, partial [Caldiserica bacterium]|nr:hypothetical protein [Caldisericota bacterium]
VGFSGNDEILSTFVRPMTIEILTTSPFSYEIALGKELVENISTSDGKIIAKAGSVFTDEILAKLLKHDIEKTFVKVKGIDFWVEQTLKKDRTNNPNEAKIEIYKLFHPRERVTIEAAE